MLSSFSTSRRVHSGRETAVMPALRDIFTAFAPAYLEALSPHLPLSPHKALRAMQHCRSGHYGHRLSQGQSGGGHHRVHHACGHRHCPPCLPHTTPQWLPPHREKQLPGPHLPPHRHGPCNAPPLPPLASTPRVPGPVPRVCDGPQTAGPRRTFPWDGPAGVPRRPAPLGPATPVSPPPPL